MEYPRIYVSAMVHKKVQKAAKKLNVPMNKLGDKIAIAGMKALKY